jgi:hypothetical protein
MQSVQEVVRALGEYDKAFNQLTCAADPVAFRDFLLAAPAVFTSVGDKLGALQHIVSFWRYRVGESNNKQLSASDLSDILRDFEASLGCGNREGAVEAA